MRLISEQKLRTLETRGTLKAIIILFTIVSSITLSSNAAASGASWREMDSGTTNHLWGICGYAVGQNGILLRYLNGSWIPGTWSYGTPTNLHDIHYGRIVGANGTIGKVIDGEIAAGSNLGTSYSLNGVWMLSPTDGFVVGDRGVILRYNGLRWTDYVIDSGTTDRLNAVWAFSGNDVFIVGDNGTIIHYDGLKCNKMASGTSISLQGVWGTSSNNVFAVGWYGTILHYNGTSWTKFTIPSFYHFWDVWGAAANDIFAVGDDDYYVGVVYHYDGANWNKMTIPYKSGGSLLAFGELRGQMFLP